MFARLGRLNYDAPPIEEWAQGVFVMAGQRAEPYLAMLNQMRQEWSDDKESIEYQTLDRALRFLSYRMGEFQAYLNEESDLSKKED